MGPVGLILVADRCEVRPLCAAASADPAAHRPGITWHRAARQGRRRDRRHPRGTAVRRARRRSRRRAQRGARRGQRGTRHPRPPHAIPTSRQCDLPPVNCHPAATASPAPWRHGHRLGGGHCHPRQRSHHQRGSGPRQSHRTHDPRRAIHPLAGLSGSPHRRRHTGCDHPQG